MRPLQRFSKEYLDLCRKLKPEEIIEFLENFRELHSSKVPGKSRLISIKIPESLLKTFKMKAALNNVPYQTQIKRLMLQWLDLSRVARD